MALKQANSVTVAVGQKVQDLIWVNSIFTHQVTPTSFLSTIELVVSGIHSIQVAIYCLESASVPYGSTMDREKIPAFACQRGNS